MPEGSAHPLKRGGGRHRAAGASTHAAMHEGGRAAGASARALQPGGSAHALQHEAAGAVALRRVDKAVARPLQVASPVTVVCAAARVRNSGLLVSVRSACFAQSTMTMSV
jgi:hypothetical protein